MSFQFIPFNKLKNNFFELKDLLPAENAKKIKLIESIISQLISSNAEEMEKSRILTGAILMADLVLPQPAPSSPSNMASKWHIVDLDTDTTPRKVSIPIQDVDSVIGVSKDNQLDVESRRSAIVAYQRHTLKSESERKGENAERRSIFASRAQAFGGSVVEEKEVTYNFRRKN